MERWAGSDEASTRAAVESAEVVVVYGSDRTVDAIRAATPATTRFVGYHHRFGIAAVGADALAAGSLARTADGVAFAASMFDQRGCVSTQVVFVEAGTTPLERFADEVAEALARMERRLPSAPVLEGRSSALQQLRGTAELLAHAGSGYVRHGAGDGPWTVVVESEDGPPLPNAGRMIRLRPFADLDELVACLAPWAEHLQTLGVAGFGDRTEEVALRCGRAGVARVTNLEAIPFPAPEWLHDGRGPLRELVRWVERAWEG
jgi:hypothetical protein